MGLKELAEGIILQSMEDLWDADLRDDGIAFFGGRDFDICAKMANIDVIGQIKLLNMVREVLELDGQKTKMLAGPGRKRHGGERPEREAVAS